MGSDHHILTVENIWTEPGDVTVVSFEPDPRLDYRAGQQVQIVLDVPDVEEGTDSRTFGLASAPHEDLILVGARVARPDEPDPFIRRFQDLEPGDEVAVTAPEGEFTLEDQEKRKEHVFLGLGVGATTIRGLAHSSAAAGLDTRVLLTPNAGGYPFEDDFQRLEKTHDHVDFERLDTVPDAPEVLTPRVPHPIANTLWYVAGPPEDVMAARNALLEGDLPQNQVKSEAFSGPGGGIVREVA